MGSAFKNKGVQPLLDGVVSYLPAPTAREGVCALDLENDEAPVPIECDSDAPLLALAFKLEESRFGQLTYVRIYQGTLKKGDYIQNVRTQITDESTARRTDARGRHGGDRRGVGR